MSSDTVCLDLQPYRNSTDEEQNGPPALSPASRRLARDPPKDYVLWSLFNLLFLSGYCFCCLSFAALVFSIKARDQKVTGDLEAAHRYSSKAKCYNILATMWSVVLPLVLIALVITGVLHLSKLAQESMDYLAYRLFPDDAEDKK
ncbi:interferon-induced transmembrane protein 5 isoform X1 [Candoia aspera]|uniref:interferon-induced transmembrane protein 5 isoform X1 n=1 Tax=Candoia aspera TaxID=51853 RepID=UPI002FD7D59A